MKEVIHVISSMFKRATPETARSILIGTTIGVLSCVKLLVRLATQGSIVLTAVREGIDTIEEFSDKVAEEFYDKIAGDLLEAGSFDTRLGTKRFERTDTTLTFRFAPPLNPYDVVSPELHDTKLLGGIANEVIGGLMNLLDRRLSKLRDRQLVYGRLSFIIGFTAAAKVLMAYWGEGELASGIEAIADMDSAGRYRGLVGDR